MLVQPETVLGWHRQLVRRKWALYRRTPRRVSSQWDVIWISFQ
jgi:hypothetical protein